MSGRPSIVRYLRFESQFVFGASPLLPEQEPLPEHEPLPEQEALVPSVEAGAAEPAGAAPLAEQLAFAPAADGSVAAGGLLPPQPAMTPNMIPETAETARTLPIFIVDSSVTSAALRVHRNVRRLSLAIRRFDSDRTDFVYA